jgi:hypothetical protein
LLQMSVVFAEFERAMVRERVFANWRGRRENVSDGRRPSRPSTDSYRCGQFRLSFGRGELLRSEADGALMIKR